MTMHNDEALISKKIIIFNKNLKKSIQNKINYFQRCFKTIWQHTRHTTQLIDHCHVSFNSYLFFSFVQWKEKFKKIKISSKLIFFSTIIDEHFRRVHFPYERTTNRIFMMSPTALKIKNKKYYYYY